MFRYIALIWNPADPAQKEAAQLARHRIQLNPKWCSAFNQDGIGVFYAGARRGTSEPYHLQNRSGVVLGTLFERGASLDGTPRRPLLGPRETAPIVASAGRALLESYWGRYVAFLRDSQHEKTWVLRDPTGALPCLSMRFQGVEICFSRMEDAACLDLLPFTLNWPYLTGQLVASLLETRETALLEVSKILAGECLEFHGSTISRSFYWDPFRFARSERIERADEATALLRQTVKGCVRAWASRYDSILHRLSGGLDSSIIVGCLGDPAIRPRITCLNYYSEGSDSDERDFARRTAQHAGLDLVERERDSRVPLQTLLRMPPLAEPLFFAPLQIGRSELEALIAREYDAGAIFDGNGGDGLFYQNPITPTVADYVEYHGVGPSLFSIALHAARIEEVSVWSVLRTALEQRFRRRQWNAFEATFGSVNLLQREALHAVETERLLHPWFQDRAGVPPGKLWHIFHMSIPLNIEDPLASPGDPEQVTPLISQPIFEQCLRIPTYVLTTGGWDRAIARKAFIGDVPAEILKRRSKGGVEDHVKAIVLQNIHFIRELLLDGTLVRENLIDRAKLEEALSGDPSAVAVGSVELFTVLSTEAWLHTWSRTPRTAAAQRKEISVLRARPSDVASETQESELS